MFEQEAKPGVPMNDVEEVSNYVSAMNYGLTRVRDEGFPISVRLLKKMHARLLSSGRGSEKEPGEIRRSQNWIGGTRPGNAEFVPPPPVELAECLSRWEAYLHESDEPYPSLIRTALLHAQFETIHPFLDGNGRLGRLMITLFLYAEEILEEPTLYLSLYFKRNRTEYFRHLQRNRTHGEWEEWIRFFLQGIVEVSSQAFTTAKEILTLFETDRERLRSLGQAAGSALRLHDVLQKKPLVSIPDAAEASELRQPTVGRAFERMERLGLLEETTGKKRNRIFAYSEYLELLSEATGPLQ